MKFIPNDSYMEWVKLYAFFEDFSLSQMMVTLFLNKLWGDLILILSGNKSTTQKQMSELRLKLGKDLNLYKENDYQPIWVVDFPLLEKDEESTNNVYLVWFGIHTINDFYLKFHQHFF